MSMIDKIVFREGRARDRIGIGPALLVIGSECRPAARDRIGYRIGSEWPSDAGACQEHDQEASSFLHTKSQYIN